MGLEDLLNVGSSIGYPHNLAFQRDSSKTNCPNTGAELEVGGAESSRIHNYMTDLTWVV